MADPPEKVLQFSVIRELCREVQFLDGDAAEIGVYQGDSAEVICEALSEATVYLFDTFAGMPAVARVGLDEHVAGDFGDTSIERVQRKLDRFENAYLIPGCVPQSFEGHDHVSLAFTHIDCDLYESTKAALAWAWEHTIPGGVILDDDYGCLSCLGAKKAVDEFIAENPRTSFVVRDRLAIIRRK